MMCPACGSIGVELGVLGQLTWYRCEDCGFEFAYNHQIFEEEING